MKRFVSMEEISDGKLYGSNDMVKADCGGCKGCCECCKGMGNSIILDPYDAFRLTTGLQRDFNSLLSQEVELNVVDGVILPNLKMIGAEEACSFLNEEGRCSIHAIRPGICRLFPLGRFYENHSFRYFLQTGECPQNRTKIKVDKWIATPNLKAYESFVCEWHYLVNDIEEKARTALEQDETQGMERSKQLSMLLLQIFFLLPYDEKTDFYEQFKMRKNKFWEMSNKM